MARVRIPKRRRWLWILVIAGVACTMTLAMVSTRPDDDLLPMPDVTSFIPSPAPTPPPVPVVEQPHTPAVDVAPIPKATPNREHRVAAAPAPKKPGFFSIDSRPFAHISVDDHVLGDTPLVHKPLSAGKHHIKAVRKDGQSKVFDVVIPSGANAEPINLTW